MVQISHAKGSSSTRFPHIANMTGRASTIGGNHQNGRAKINTATVTKSSLSSSRNAMSDRTNGHATTLNDPTFQKVMQSSNYVRFIW